MAPDVDSYLTITGCWRTCAMAIGRPGRHPGGDVEPRDVDRCKRTSRVPSGGGNPIIPKLLSAYRRSTDDMVATAYKLEQINDEYQDMEWQEHSFAA